MSDLQEAGLMLIAVFAGFIWFVVVVKLAMEDGRRALAVLAGVPIIIGLCLLIFG